MKTITFYLREGLTLSSTVDDTALEELLELVQTNNFIELEQETGGSLQIIPPSSIVYVEVTTP